VLLDRFDFCAAFDTLIESSFANQQVEMVSPAIHKILHVLHNFIEPGLVAALWTL